MAKKVDLIKQQLELYLANPELTMQSKGWNKATYDETITQLEQKIKNSKRGKSSRNRGASYERTIAKKIKEILGIELKRTPQSGGFAKDSTHGADFRGDIVSIDDNLDFKLHVECKDTVTWQLPSWLKQAEGDCPKGKVPIVVFHRRQLDKDGKRVQEAGDYVSLKLEDFLEVVDQGKIAILKNSPVLENRPKLKRIKGR